MAKGGGSPTFLEGAFKTGKKDDEVSQQELMSTKKDKTTGKKAQEGTKKNHLRVGASFKIGGQGRPH